MELYHGSNVVVQEPKILVNGFYKDFGYGFYCTGIEKQASKWARAKRNSHVVNVYEYNESDNLKICIFSEMTDDTIWDYVEDFIRGNITREAFWVLAKFKYPTHQIVFCTQKALDGLKYVRSYVV